MSKAIVYGSLREGMYNAASFQRTYGTGYNKIGEATLEGYKLFSLGTYPFVSESLATSDELKVDIYECSEECFDSIDRMELGAGYETRDINVIDNEGVSHEGRIYVMTGMNEESYTQVEDGDWVNYKTT